MINIHLCEGIANALASIAIASGGSVALISEEIEKARGAGKDLDTAEMIDHLRIYRQGYKAALAAVAIALGVEPNSYAIDPEVNGHDLPRCDSFRLPSWEK